MVSLHKRFEKTICSYNNFLVLLLKEKEKTIPNMSSFQQLQKITLIYFAHFKLNYVVSNERGSTEGYETL